MIFAMNFLISINAELAESSLIVLDVNEKSNKRALKAFAAILDAEAGKKGTMQSRRRFWITQWIEKLIASKIDLKN